METIENVENLEKETTVEVKSGNWKAVTSLVLGIIGLLAWFFPILGLPITVVGLVFGIKGRSSLKKGMAVAGITLCIIGLVLTIINASIGAYMGAIGRHSIVNKVLENDGGSDTGDLKQETISGAISGIKEQMTLPSEIDSVTTLVDVTAQPSAIRYEYILSIPDTGVVTDEMLKNNLVTSLCKDENTSWMLGEGINMEYSYKIKDSTTSFFVTVSDQDCL